MTLVTENIKDMCTLTGFVSVVSIKKILRNPYSNSLYPYDRFCFRIRIYVSLYKNLENYNQEFFGMLSPEFAKQ